MTTQIQALLKAIREHKDQAQQQAVERLPVERPALRRPESKGKADLRRLHMNWAFINGEISPRYMNPATGKVNQAPVATYDGSATKPYQIKTSIITPTGLFCDCHSCKFKRKEDPHYGFCKHIEAVQNILPDATIYRLMDEAKKQ